MSRRRITQILLAAALAAATLGAAGERPDRLTGTWKSKLPIFGDSIRFDMRTDDGRKLVWRLDVDELTGVSRSELKTTGAPLSFGLVRDAATLKFVGEGRWLGRPSGTFELESSERFAELLRSVGCGTPSTTTLLRLMTSDVSEATLLALAEAGYEDLDVDDLARFRAHGVDAAYIRDMRGLGYPPDPEGLVRLRNHGVNADYARGLSELGLSGIPVDDLVRFRSHGVSPEYLRGMADAGIPPDEVDDLLRLRNHGVDPDEAAGMRAVRGFDLDVEDLIVLRSHGVDADYLARIANADGPPLTVDDVRRLRNHGISPSRYAALAGLGYGQIDQVIRLTNHGVAAETVSGFADLGYVALSVDDLIRLQTRGVGVEFVRELVDDGHTDLTVEELIEARTHGGVPSRSSV